MGENVSGRTSANVLMAMEGDFATRKYGKETLPGPMPVFKMTKHDLYWRPFPARICK